MTKTNRVMLTAVAFLSYALTGGLVTVSGLVMGTVAKYFQIPISDMGNTFTFLNSGILIAIFVNAWLMDIVKLKTQLIAGFILMLLALLGLVIGHNLIFFSVCMFVFGIISGITMSIGTFLITELYQGARRGSFLLLSDSFFSMASMIFPLICSAILVRNLSWIWVYASIGVIYIVVFFLSLGSTFPKLGKHKTETEQSNAPKESWGVGVFLICIAALCYILGQMGFVSWMPSYVEKHFNLNITDSGALESSFWTAYMVGMWVFSIAIRYIDVQKLLVILAFFASCFMWMFIHSEVVSHLVIFIVLLGFFSSAIYTSLITLGSFQTKVPSAKLVNFVLTCGTVGTMLTFVATSPIVKHYGFRTTLGFTTGLYFAVFVLCILIGFVSKHHKHGHTTTN